MRQIVFRHMRLAPRLLQLFTQLLLVGLLTIGSMSAIAQEEEVPRDPNSLYVPLQPAFVVNFGGVGRLKYLKAEITVRVQNADTASAVRHHLPYIRNNLVLLFSRQTDEDLDTQVGKEALRQAALEEVRNILEMESQIGGVIDLYFENFIVQK